jgi:XTP/dITP diphosphohydrolase
MTTLVVATRSPDKLREIGQMLEGIPDLRVLDLEGAGLSWEPEEEHIEVFDTFRGNAEAKARYYAGRSGELTLADDSGICVDALGGAPGVYSKRFSGRTDLGGAELDRANNTLLLQRLRDLPQAPRTAHYLCTIALVHPAAGREAVVQGRCDGIVLPEPRGAGGFGYDPLFWLPREEATFAQLAPARKNEISHRARAVRAAAVLLADPLHPAWTRGTPPPPPL